MAIEMRPFGKTGLRVSALGLGTAELGIKNTDHHVVDRIVGLALDLGINVIDTAAQYSDSEHKLGRALRGRRERCLLFTKCGRSLPRGRSMAKLHLRLRRKLRNTLGKVEEAESLTWQPRALKWNIEESLVRLRTDWLDMVQLHTCSEDHLRRGDVIEVLQRARQAGKVRHIGYTGDGPAALYAVHCGQFDAVQVSINIADQDALGLLLPPARAQGLGVIAKRPIANSLWSSARRPEFPNQAYWDRLQRLQYDFLQDGHAVGTALRFTLSVPGVHTAVVGTANPEHLRQNAEFAAAGALDRRQFEMIRARWTAVASPDWVGQT